MNEKGKHLIMDMWGVEKTKKEHLKETKEKIKEIAKNHKNTILDEMHYIFPNNAFSFIIFLAESHISLHTWPEKEFISLDFYTCSEKTDMEKVAIDLAKFFKPKKIKQQIINRGQSD